MATLNEPPSRDPAAMPARHHQCGACRRRRVAGDRAASCRSSSAAIALFQFSSGAGLCHRAHRAQHAGRIQRPDLARPRRVLRDRRLYAAMLMDKAGFPIGRPCRRRSICLVCRLSFRPAGAAARGSLSRARHLCARGGDAADPQGQGLRALDRRRPGYPVSTSPRRRSGCRSTRTSGSIISA